MNFKKEYEKAFTDISADDAFKKRLADEMNHASASRTRIRPYAGMLVTAAVLAIMVGAVYYTGVMYDTETPPDNTEEILVVQGNSEPKGNVTIEKNIDVKTDGEIDEYSVQTFVPKATGGGADQSDEEEYDLFISLISGDELERLYCSDEQDFTEDDIVSAEQVDVLVKKLFNAVDAENAKEKNIMYYKAVLKDNRTILFEIWNEEYIRIAGTETIYRIKE